MQGEILSDHINKIEDNNMMHRDISQNKGNENIGENNKIKLT